MKDLLANGLFPQPLASGRGMLSVSVLYISINLITILPYRAPGLFVLNEFTDWWIVNNRCGF